MKITKRDNRKQIYSDHGNVGNFVHIVVYFTTLSELDYIASNGTVIGELERILKEAALA